MPAIDLPDDELAAVTAALRSLIEADKYPHAPRLDPLKAALARFEAASESSKPVSDPKRFPRRPRAGGLVAREKPSEDRNNDAEDRPSSCHYWGNFCRLVGSSLCGSGGLIALLILLFEPSIRKMRVVAELVSRGDEHSDFPFPHLLKAGPPFIVDLAIFDHTGSLPAQNRLSSP
jgi:hypothetical protein